MSMRATVARRLRFALGDRARTGEGEIESANPQDSKNLFVH